MHNTIFIRALAGLLSFILATGVPTVGSTGDSLRKLSELTEISEVLTETTEKESESAENQDDDQYVEAEKAGDTETSEPVKETAPTEEKRYPTEEKTDPIVEEKESHTSEPAKSGEASESVSISVSQYVTDISSDGSAPLVTITAGGLRDGKYKARIYYKATTAGSFNYKEKDLSSDGTAVFNQYPALSNGRSYEIYAALYFAGNEAARSQTVTINAVKPTVSSKDITAAPSFEGQSTGSITVEGDHRYLAYYPYGGAITGAVKVSGNTITGLAAGQYYVFVPAYSEQNTYYIRSSSQRVTVGQIEAEHYAVSFASDEQSSWEDGDKTVSVIQGSGKTIVYSVSIDSEYKNTRILDGVTVLPENATLNIEKSSDTSWTVTVSDITGDVTVTAKSKPIPEYTVSLTQAEGAKWSGASGSFTIKKTSSRSVYVKPTDANRFFITGVEVRPEQNASVTFSESTGEVYIEKVTGDVELVPIVEEKSVPSSVSVTGVDFNEHGIYSESDPAIKVTFTVEVSDQFGNAVPGQAVYFKDDVSEVSFVQSRKTDSEGKALITYTYGISSGRDKADFNALFSTGSGFAETDVTASQELHLVRQKKADLVLYESQIIGTTPGEHNGRVINVPDNYEIWTGEVHQGALAAGSGSWTGPVNGEFAGLSSGQHVIRAGEKIDNDTTTFYFASDYADFFVPRGLWRVRVDTDASENVIFKLDVELTAEPGGTVYVYVEPEEGYVITSYSVDRPGYVSALYYDEEEGFIAVESITGSVVLTVKAEPVQDDAQTEDASETDVLPDNTSETDVQTDDTSETDVSIKEEHQDEGRQEDEAEDQAPAPVVYEVIEGKGSVWFKESKKALTIRISAEYEKFTGARLDGKALPKDKYTVRRGSTVISIGTDFLESLSLGDHTLTVEFTDGYASMNFTVSQPEVKGEADRRSEGQSTPSTGDQTNAAAFTINLSLLMLYAAVLLLKKKGVILPLLRRG